jgi:nitrilase
VKIVYADLDASRARASRHQFDPVGHYGRADVFRLTVDNQARSPVAFTDAGARSAPDPTTAADPVP